MSSPHWHYPFALAAFAALLALCGCGGGGGGGGGGSAPPIPPPVTPPVTPSIAFADPAVYSSAPGAALTTATEAAAVTHHQLALGGVTLDYTATAGHLTARDPASGAPKASFFYVAYTVDNRDAATRPVTFFYNGGPGSATVWLHLGSFGPQRLVTGVPSTSAPTPYPLVANSESLLDVSDLVFVDAVGSGYSQAIAPNTNRTFWGVDADAAVFRDFVTRYLAANNRQASPKYLFGESYGTTRSAVLANLLESAGVELSGVVLQSSVLDYNSNCAVTGLLMQSCAAFLPTYGAAGAWYSLANVGPGATALGTFLGQLRTLASTLFDPAVRAFLSAGTAPDAGLIGQLVAATGLPAARWQFRFNMNPNYVQTSLIPGTVIGRYDARVSAPAGSFLASEGDPSSTVLVSSFVAAIGRYLSNDLLYTNASPYVTLSDAINFWNFSHDGEALPDSIPDLAAALAQNPALKVLAVSGFHDLATPFYLTELDLARLGPTPNVQTRNYTGGHMTYLDDAARIAQKADLVQFYQRSLAAP